MVISPLWLQGVILTFMIGFTMLGYLALRVYQDHAPVPGKVVSESTGRRFSPARTSSRARSRS